MDTETGDTESESMDPHAVTLFNSERSHGGRRPGSRRELDDSPTVIVSHQRDRGHSHDEDLGEGNPSITRWELDQAKSLEFEERTAGVEHALSKPAERAHGICELCGEPIHPD